MLLLCFLKKKSLELLQCDVVSLLIITYVLNSYFIVFSEFCCRDLVKSL